MHVKKREPTLSPECEGRCQRRPQTRLEQVLCELILVPKELEENSVSVVLCKLLQATAT